MPLQRLKCCLLRQRAHNGSSSGSQLMLTRMPWQAQNMNTTQHQPSLPKGVVLAEAVDRHQGGARAQSNLHKTPSAAQHQVVLARGGVQALGFGRQGRYTMEAWKTLAGRLTHADAQPHRSASRSQPPLQPQAGYPPHSTHLRAAAHSDGNRLAAAQQV